MSTFAVPSPALNWRILSNIAVGGTGNGTNDYRDFWFKIKQILTNAAPYAGAWKDVHGSAASDPTACTVTYSNRGDGTYGAADYIASSSNIIHNSVTANHTYIVFSFPGVSSTAELLFEFCSAGAAYTTLASNGEYRAASPPNANRGGFFFSQDGGFSTNGGTATVRPWAAKETQIFNRRSMTSGIVYFGNLSSSTTWTGKLHVLRTADGSCTRMVFFYNGVPIWFFFLEVPGSAFHTNASPDHTWNADDLPWFGAVYGSGSAVSAGLYNGTPNWAGSTVNLVSNSVSNTNPTTEAVVSVYPVLPYSAAVGDYLIGANASAPNAGDGGYYPAPAGVAIAGGGYFQPWAGTWRDMYFVGNNMTDGASGAEDPLSSGYSWRKVGNFLMPWDRSTLQTS